jgi:hypothetical protein
VRGRIALWGVFQVSKNTKAQTGADKKTPKGAGDKALLNTIREKLEKGEVLTGVELAQAPRLINGMKTDQVESLLKKAVKCVQHDPARQARKHQYLQQLMKHAFDSWLREELAEMH